MYGLKSAIFQKGLGWPCPVSATLLVAAAEIRDHETGLVSRPFSWFQSRQIFCETHETETNPMFLVFSHFYPYLIRLRPCFCIKQWQHNQENTFQRGIF